MYIVGQKSPCNKELSHSKGHCGFPDSSVLKNPPANARATGEAGSIPGLERSPGGGNGSPLQYSCWENPMDRGAWWVISNVEEGLSRSFSGCGGKPLFPSTSAGDIRELPTVPLRGEPHLFPGSCVPRECRMPSSLGSHLGTLPSQPLSPEGKILQYKHTHRVHASVLAQLRDAGQVTVPFRGFPHQKAEIPPSWDAFKLQVGKKL